MMKKRKQLTLIVVMLMLVISLFSGCKKTEETVTTVPETTETSVETVEEVKVEVPVHSTDPMEMILEGRYFTSYFAEGYGDFTSYFHFYPEAENLGAVFYLAYNNNGSTYAGTYTVEKKDFEYAVYNTRDEVIAEGEKTTGTAPYTITFFDWDGTELDCCGFDGDIVYNDLDVLIGAGGKNIIYTHELDPEQSTSKDIYAAEVGVVYLDFVADNDETSTVSLFHNGTYNDLMNMMVTGKWDLTTVNADGKVFTLTPDDGSDVATLSVAADQVKANYSIGSSEAIPMTNTASLAATVVTVFEGIQNLATYGVDAELTLSMFSDGTVSLDTYLFSQDINIDKGTYTQSEDGYNYVFDFDLAGEITSTIDTAAQTLVLQYVGSVEKLGDFDTTLTINPDAVATAAEILFSFTGTYTTFDCYTDNTYAFNYKDYNLTETGTWAFDPATYSFTLTQENGNVITAGIVGDAHDLTFEYVAVASDQLKDTFVAAGDVWTAALYK